MADGQPRKPLWNATHRHLDRALAVCGLSPCEQTIMVIAREESYGKARLRKLPDPLPFRVNLTRLAEAVGYSRKAVTIAWGHLVESRVILPAEDAPGYFRINKRYREWTARHALTARALAFADSALGARHPGYIEVLPIGNQQPSEVLPIGNGQVLPIGNTTDVAGVTDRLREVLPIGNTFESPPKNPLVGREIKDSLPAAAPARAPAHAREADAEGGGAAAAAGLVREHFGEEGVTLFEPEADRLCRDEAGGDWGRVHAAILEIAAKRGQIRSFVGLLVSAIRNPRPPKAITAGPRGPDPARRRAEEAAKIKKLLSEGTR